MTMPMGTNASVEHGVCLSRWSARASRGMSTSGGPDRPYDLNCLKGDGVDEGHLHNRFTIVPYNRNDYLLCKLPPILTLIVVLIACTTAVPTLAAPSSSNEVRIPYTSSVFSAVFASVPFSKITTTTVGSSNNRRAIADSNGSTDTESSKESSASSDDYDSIDDDPAGFWTYFLRPGFASQSDSQIKESTNATDERVPYQKGQCKDGLILPAWRPLEPLSTGDRWARGILYFLGLVYMFVGISIIADRFMAAIEVITSLEKQVTITTPDGERQLIAVRVWNETVSNLTLMALGSSAPEILLSVIEIYAENFEAGDLGPGTIVGSAAFNLFVIIAICVWAVPSPEVRQLEVSA